MTDLLGQIRATPWLLELLRVEFDFDLGRVDPVEEVHLPNGDPLTPVAGDSGGGSFLLTPSGAVVYAGSEGEGGLIATNLRDALALVVGLPSLHDALSQPGDEAWLAECDDEIRAEQPDLDDNRARARDALGLPPAATLLDALVSAAADDNFRPVSEHGPYEPMLS
ncbi:hypothetical protein [Actinoplanes sp. NPDC051411]|uniref:hypothetical protein n=1 Tax=Actinoplanes sp. NPDC051411 TaxID=3155522 RepID=UPI0034276A9C